MFFNKDKKNKKKKKATKAQVGLSISPFDNLADPQALKEAQDIIDRSYRGEINLNESLRLLVISMVQHSIDPHEALRAVHHAVKKFVQTTQYTMLVHAMKTIADDVQFSTQLDTLGQEVLVKMVTGEEKMIKVTQNKDTGEDEIEVCTLPPKDRIAAFRELRTWRKDRRADATDALKLFYELERIEKFIQTMDELVQAGMMGTGELGDKIQELPPEDRRDVAILMRWIVKSRNVNVDGMIVALEQTNES